MESSEPQYPVSVERDAESSLIVRLSGSWRLAGSLPSLEPVERELKATPRARRLVFDSEGLSSWDTSLLTFVARVREICGSEGVEIDLGGLPPGLRRMLELAGAVPEKEGARRGAGREPLVARVGDASIAAWRGSLEMLAFLGDATVALLRLARGKARFRASDLALFIQQAGAEALPIVTLISFLVGSIFAFVGAIQLQKFGAQIYVADLVAIAMVREMGAVMTGIIMAGRTGAAYAAQLGTMKVTQETDALTTLASRSSSSWWFRASSPCA